MNEIQFGDYQMLSLLSQSSGEVIDLKQDIKFEQNIAPLLKSENKVKDYSCKFEHSLDISLKNKNLIDYVKPVNGEISSRLKTSVDREDISLNIDVPKILQDAIFALHEHTGFSKHLILHNMLIILSGFVQVKKNVAHSFLLHGEPCSLYGLNFNSELDKNLLYLISALMDFNSISITNKFKSVVLKDCTFDELFKHLKKDLNIRVESKDSEYILGKYSHTRGLISKAKILSRFFDEGTKTSETKKEEGRLCLNLSIQPDVLTSLLEKDDKNIHDFFARFLFTDIVNTQHMSTKEIEDALLGCKADPRLVKYWDHCEKVFIQENVGSNEMNQQSLYTVIPMTVLAKEEEHKYLLKYIHQSSELYLSPFLDRVNTLIRRIATIFAVFQEKEQIEEAEIYQAVGIVEKSIESWRIYLTKNNQNNKNAQTLFAWLSKKSKEKQITRFPYAYLQTSAPRPMQKNREILEVALDQLIAEKKIRIDIEGKKRFILI